MGEIWDAVSLNEESVSGPKGDETAPDTFRINESEIFDFFDKNS